MSYGEGDRKTRESYFLICACILWYVVYKCSSHSSTICQLLRDLHIDPLHDDASSTKNYLGEMTLPSIEIFHPLSFYIKDYFEDVGNHA